ncbi:MAG TPA: glutathione S-transferase [Spongiibacteraceae bacterium]|nr:glutathione S-transferase [Spongiibacteraceae bacterium]
MLTLYDFTLSGNCYKVRLLLSFLGLAHEVIAVDLPARAQKSTEFLQINTLGQVPTLDDDNILIRDSQAILVYLARRYGDESWLPNDAEGLALVMQWLSNAANEIAHGLAAARAFHLMNRPGIDIELATQRSLALLDAMDKHLQTRQWLELERPTIADVACFPYIALAHQGHIAILEYPHVAAWVARFKKLPRFIAMPGL